MREPAEAVAISLVAGAILFAAAASALYAGSQRQLRRLPQVPAEVTVPAGGDALKAYLDERR